MRILVLVNLATEQCTVLREDLDDALVGLEHMLADEFRQADLVGELAIVIDRRKHAEPVLLADRVVVRAVAGGDVDRTGAGLGGDELRENEL